MANLLRNFESSVVEEVSYKKRVAGTRAERGREHEVGSGEAAPTPAIIGLRGSYKPDIFSSYRFVGSRGVKEFFNCFLPKCLEKVSRLKANFDRRHCIAFEFIYLTKI